MREMRELLDRAQAAAPPQATSVDDIVRRARRRHRRVLAGRVSGVAVAAVTLVTAGSLLVAGPRPTGGAPAASQPTSAPPVAAPATAAPAPPFTFTYSEYRVGDLRVLDPTLATLTYQAGNIMREVPDPKAPSSVVARLTVYRPGAFDPTAFQAGTPVTVQGRPGYQLVGQKFWLYVVAADKRFVHLGLDGAEAPMPLVDSTAWQYADGAWATIDAEPAENRPFTAAQQLAVAERFTLSPERPRVAKAVARLGYVPAGLSLLGIDEDGMLTQAYGVPAGTTFQTGDHGVDRVPGVSLEVNVLMVDTPPPDAKPMHGRCREGIYFCTATLPGGKYYVVVEDPSHTRSDAELLKVLDNLQIANPDDPLSWYPVA